MSNAPVHVSEHQFTSTLEKEQDDQEFNIWIAIMVAIIFFLIWSIYNFMIAIYNFFIGANPNNIKGVRCRDKVNFFNVLATFGYLFLWILITILVYFVLSRKGLLSTSNTSSILYYY